MCNKLRNWLVDGAIVLFIAMGIISLRACTSSSEPEEVEPWDVPKSVPAYASDMDPPQDPRSRIRRVLWEEASRAGISYSVAYRLAWIESRFDTLAVSSKGAVGLLQVKPSSVRIPADSLFYLRVNARAGLQYLRALRTRTGDVYTALRAYHAGPTRVARGYGGSHWYARRVLYDD